MEIVPTGLPHLPKQSRNLLHLTKAKFLESMFKLLNMLNLKQLGLPEFQGGFSERFRKVREACRNNFHLVAPHKSCMVSSYDEKAKKVTTEQVAMTTSI